jgi:hypothetical protein
MARNGAAFRHIWGRGGWRRRPSRLRQGPQDLGARYLEFLIWDVLRRRYRDKEGIMDILYPRCAGLDVHKDSVVAAVRIAAAGAATTAASSTASTCWLGPAREGLAAFAGLWWDLGEPGTP